MAVCDSVLLPVCFRMLLQMTQDCKDWVL